MSRWNQAPWPRDQIRLYRETLGDRIPDNQAVEIRSRIRHEPVEGRSSDRRRQVVDGREPNKERSSPLRPSHYIDSP